MQASTRDTIEATFDDSNAGRIHFGQVIGLLSAARVESYHVDYRSGRTTCFLVSGETMDLNFEKPPHGTAAAFDGDAVRAAISSAQEGALMYSEFKQRSQRAGCVGYTVWIAGRHVTYFGRQGETHVEPFPS